VVEREGALSGLMFLLKRERLASLCPKHCGAHSSSLTHTLALSLAQEPKSLTALGPVMGEHRRAAVASWSPPVPIVITEASDMDQTCVLVEPNGATTVNENWIRRDTCMFIATSEHQLFSRPP
jgi:hypothetical protein